jgi:hypothetical protein
MGLLRSQHLGIETREANSKYSPQVQYGWLHKVSGLLRATHGVWRRKGKNSSGRGRIVAETEKDSPSETDRVAKTQPAK